jgi:glyoxylase-like metal-dependent hydrolase (beta-lactamase superfamily II)
MQVEMIMTGPLQENCYVVMDEATHDAVVVDPGDDAPRIVEAIERMGAQPIAIINTHCHFDHVGAVSALQQQYHMPFFIHPNDKEMLENAALSAANFGLTIEQPRVDRFIREGERFQIGGSELSVRYTPGHCPGHIILVGDGFALVGDVVFAGSVGRTDFPGTSWDVLAQSIKRELLTLPDDTILFPGHGPSTTVGRERSTNPFLQDL